MRFRFQFILLCLSACTSLSQEAKFDEERRKITHSALREFTKDMRAKGFNAEGIGEAIDHSNGKQKWLKVAFGVNYLPDVEYARELLIQTIKCFLDCINSKEGIQNYLTEYPFNVNFISISFVNHTNKGLLSASNLSEELYYYALDPNKPNGPCILLQKETFDEALHILAQQKENALTEDGV